MEPEEGLRCGRCGKRAPRGTHIYSDETAGAEVGYFGRACIDRVARERARQGLATFRANGNPVRTAH